MLPRITAQEMQLQGRSHWQLVAGLTATYGDG